MEGFRDGILEGGGGEWHLSKRRTREVPREADWAAERYAGDFLP